MDTSVVALLAAGALVGFLVSLDNTAATAALASRFGANLYLLVGEVLAHIVFVSVGWFVGSLLATYQDVATLVTAGVLFLLGANMLYQAFDPHSVARDLDEAKRQGRHFLVIALLKSEPDLKAVTVWSKGQESRFLWNFFLVVVPAVVVWVALLQHFMSSRGLATGLVFAAGTAAVFAAATAFAARRAGIKWP
ncbi:MAG: manganese efflux pump [Dehalococcoidia bacterium]